MAGGAPCAGEGGSERGTLECQRPRARQRCRHTPHKSARTGVGGGQERRSERSPLLVARGDHGRVHAAVERRCWRAALHPPRKPPPTPPHPTSLPGPVRPPLTPKRPPTPKPNPLSSPTLALAVCSAPGDPPPPQRVRCGVGRVRPCVPSRMCTGVIQNFVSAVQKKWDLVISAASPGVSRGRPRPFPLHFWFGCDFAVLVPARGSAHRETFRKEQRPRRDRVLTGRREGGGGRGGGGRRRAAAVATRRATRDLPPRLRKEACPRLDRTGPDWTGPDRRSTLPRQPCRTPRRWPPA